MEKPAIMKMNEFRNNVVNLINNSGLPYFVSELVLKDILTSVEKETAKQYLLEKNAYEESLRTTKNKEGDSDE